MPLLATCNDKDARMPCQLFVPLLPTGTRLTKGRRYPQYLRFEGTFVPVGTRGNYPWFSNLTGNYPLGSGKDFGFSGGTTTRR